MRVVTERTLSPMPRPLSAASSIRARLGMRWAGEITARGLIDGKSGEHDDAPFAVYAIGP